MYRIEKKKFKISEIMSSSFNSCLIQELPKRKYVVGETVCIIFLIFQIIIYSYMQTYTTIKIYI